MRFPDDLFWLIFGALVVYFIFNIFRRGGLKGALFNAKIEATIGEVEAKGPKLISQRVKVHILQRESESLIGIEIMSKSIASIEMLPVVLTQAQAAKLAGLLQQALKQQ
jgi:hypothetical protein